MSEIERNRRIYVRMWSEFLKPTASKLGPLIFADRKVANFWVGLTVTFACAFEIVHPTAILLKARSLT